MRRYAEGTAVSVPRSQEELRALARAAGATDVAIAEEDGKRFAFAFTVQGLRIRFVVPLPADEELWRGVSGARRSRHARLADLRDRETRRRWRALALVVKAKLESSASGIETFQDAFLAQIVIVDDAGHAATVGDVLRDQVAGAALKGGGRPLLLPGGGA